VTHSPRPGRRLGLNSHRVMVRPRMGAERGSHGGLAAPHESCGSRTGRARDHHRGRLSLIR
jgi:hypothetical protein